MQMQQNMQRNLGQVKSITIDGKRELTMNVGDTTTLTAKVSPSDAAIQSCTWDSSNKAVVTVDKNTGLITAVGAGTAQITAVADDGGYVDNITITVKGSGKELTGITLGFLFCQPETRRNQDIDCRPSSQKVHRQA